MGIGDYIILSVLFLWLLAVILFLWKKKKSGKCIGCSGGDCGVCGIKSQK